MSSEMSKTGWWIDNIGRRQFVTQRENGGVHVRGADGSHTAATAQTFDKWISWGWSREDAAARTPATGETDNG